jgi:hypothetical protein
MININNDVRLLTKEVQDYDQLSTDLLELINAVFTFQPGAELSCLSKPDDTLKDFLNLSRQGLLDDLLENIADYTSALPKEYRWCSEFLGTYHAADLPESTQVRMWVEHDLTGEPFGLFDEVDVEIPE